MELLTDVRVLIRTVHRTTGGPGGRSKFRFSIICRLGLGGVTGQWLPRRLALSLASIPVDGRKRAPSSTREKKNRICCRESQACNHQIPAFSQFPLKKCSMKIIFEGLYPYFQNLYRRPEAPPRPRPKISRAWLFASTAS